MNKKYIFVLVFVLILAAGGFFWWQNQKDVNELNKNLPEGVRVEKNLLGFGNEYIVKNKIDGYEFKVPKEWKGIKEIEYMPEKEVKTFWFANLTFEGLEGEAKLMGISSFKRNKDLILEDWAKKMFDDFGLAGQFNQETINNIEILKTQENIHLGGMYVFCFKENSMIYTITGGSEEFIQEIISNGKW